MLLFKTKCIISRPFQIIFLCGSKHTSNDSDKRNVLKKYFASKDNNSYAIILEPSLKRLQEIGNYPGKEDHSNSSLLQLEKMISLYADSIFIIHETFSTAAELGIFASNPTLVSKICLLIPDRYSIEEDKLSGFLQAAFYSDSDKSSKVHLIRYYPDTELQRHSVNKSEYNTYFHKNTIGYYLSGNIDHFLKTLPEEMVFSIINKNRRKSRKNDIVYTISKDSATILAEVSTPVLKHQLTALINTREIKKELRKEKRISEHITFLKDVYYEVLKDSIAYTEGMPSDRFDLKCELKERECTIWEAIRYYLIFLQTAEFIHLKKGTQNSESDASNSLRKVSFTNEFDCAGKQLSSMFEEVQITAFGGLDL